MEKKKSENSFISTLKQSKKKKEESEGKWV